VLLGWELGDGLGHVRRLGRLARALADSGLRPVLAVKDLTLARVGLGDASFPLLQAPLFRPNLRAEQSFLAASYADILAIRGFATVEELWPRVQAWLELIDQVRPALVVCDYSPTLCLAACGLLPALVVGEGFGVPPTDGPTFPLLIPGRALLVPEERLLAVVQEVQRRRGLPAPDTLPGLLTTGRCFLTCLPELDPYQGLRRGPYLGPVGKVLGPPLPPPAQAAFFAYLRAGNSCAEQIVAGLARSGCPGTVYLRGATPELRERVRQRGVEVLDTPAVLDQVLPRTAVVVHHGGLGLAEIALAAGRPQLLFPEHLEQVLTAQLLDRLEVGRYLVGRLSGETVTQTLDRLLAGAPYTAAAQAAACIVRERGPCDSLRGIVECCLSLARHYPLPLPLGGIPAWTAPGSAC